MFNKKAVTVIFVFMLLLVLAACGTDNNQNNDEAGGSSDSDVNDAENNDEGEEEEEGIQSLSMGFIPSQEADELADTVEPLAERLSEVLGVEVEASVMTDYVGLIEAMRTQRVDIGFLNPFGYVQAEDRADVQVILKSERFGSDSYLAQYNVLADSDIETIEDLVATEGLVWAYPDDLSTSGFLFPASQLNHMGVENLNEHFIRTPVGGHDNALISLLDGQADFATTFDDARGGLEDEFPNIYDDVRVIGFTDPIPNDTVSVRSELPQEWADKIQEAFLSFNDDEEMLIILDEVYNWTGITTAKAEDYQIVRDVFEQFEAELSE